MDLVAQSFAATARRVMANRDDDPEVLAARNDPNDFCEYCFLDTRTGKRIIQAPHHRLWQVTVNQNKRVVFWLPIEHGKTTQVKMTLCRLMGQHGDRQYAVVGSKAEQAQKVTRAVKQEIESNHRLRRVYPRLKPMRAVYHSGLEQWGVEAMRVVDCPRGSTDPSLAAYGMDGKILGSRLHGIIVDNGLDSSNTNSEELRLKTVERLKDEIFGRVMDGGFIWMMDTAWFLDDFMHYFGSTPGWKSVRLDAEVPLRKKDKTLWPAQWSKARLIKKRDEELGPTAYDRQFRSMPLSQTMDFFKKKYWDAAYARVPWCETLEEAPAGLPLATTVRTGVDLATRKGKKNDYTVFTTVMAAGHRRRLINMQHDQLQATEILSAMLPIYRQFHKPVNEAGGDAKFIVEDNGAQVYIVDMMKDARLLRMLGLTEEEIGDIRVEGRTTTGDKRDEEFGIQSLVSGLEMGRWDIAANTETRALREEMKTWYPEQKHYGDRLMSLWFAAASMASMSADVSVDYI